MRTDNRFEEIDKIALQRALLAMRVCPHCRKDLKPVVLYDEVYACDNDEHPFESWYLPKEINSNER